MIDIETAKAYMRDLERDAEWLTEYAQDKEEGQRLIYMTVTMNRARWLIAELLNGQNDCQWK